MLVKQIALLASNRAQGLHKILRHNYAVCGMQHELMYFLDAS